jgi:predicted acetyltransferase
LGQPVYTFLGWPITNLFLLKKNDGFKMEDIVVKKMMFLESKSLLKCVLWSLIMNLLSFCSKIKWWIQNGGHFFN